VTGRDDVEEAPDTNEEWLLYQTLVGVWPLAVTEERATVARVREYMRKALREAKVHSSWIEPGERYERAVDRFVASALSRSNGTFLRALRSFSREVAFAGAMTSLAQTVVKIASPGVPDLYQGTETWNLRLVDPDNREPVDFETARASLRLLDEREGAVGADRCAAELVESWPDGRVKQWVTSRALRCRRSLGPLFGEGSYDGLPVAGRRDEHAVAFARRLGDGWAVAVVGRWFAALCPGGRYADVSWDDTAVAVPPNAPGVWTDVLTSRRVSVEGGRLPIADVLAVLPAALLVPEGGP
jgi:(1->4)-alpha-D-glucan 1-alpha-D-glucosylmutase